MNNLLFGAASALWLGILTSISPCPLATNIAAVSFIGRRVGNTRGVFASGLLYTLGRTLAYLALGILLVASLLSIPRVSFVLQKYMNRALGPLLIITGMFLLELISIGLPGGGVGEWVRRRAERADIWGAGLLGVLFALSFCPVSAALFFGSLIPLAVKYRSGFLLPSIYGIGTGLPVLVFTILIAVGSRAVGKAFDRLAGIELWARRVTGVIFIGVGIYYTLVYIFAVI